MALRARIPIIACAIALLAQVGCSRQVTRPDILDVRLSTGAVPETGSPSRPVTIEARATNAGTVRVWHCEGCDCGNGIGVKILAPNGDEALLTDPRAPRPLCPDGPAPLEPRGSVTLRIVFTGTLYVPDSPTYPSPTYAAPPGTYTVLVDFGYGTRGIFPFDYGLSRRTAFEWQPEAGASTGSQ